MASNSPVHGGVGCRAEGVGGPMAALNACIRLPLKGSAECGLPAGIGNQTVNASTHKQILEAVECGAAKLRLLLSGRACCESAEHLSRAA